eukprot:2490335-Rhodomonas_salina.1
MVTYGSLPESAVPAAGPKRSSSMLAAVLSTSAVLVLMAMVVLHADSRVELAEKNPYQTVRDYSNRPFLVPRTAVNYDAGTRASVSSPFEDSAMDKAPMQQLAEEKQQNAQKWAYDWSGTSVPVPRTALNFRKGTRFSPSAEFENDAMDKAPMQQLAEKQPQVALFLLSPPLSWLTDDGRWWWFDRDRSGRTTGRAP